MGEEEKACCGVFEKLYEEYDLPFDRPILLRDGQLKVGAWSVRLLKKTPSGRISKKGSASIILNFCPFCGQDLEKEGTEL